MGASNWTVASYFADRTRRTGHNMRTDGEVVWSYGEHFPIAAWLGNSNKCLFNHDKNSMSTSAHQNLVERALRGKGTTLFHCTTDEIQEYIRNPLNPPVITRYKPYSSVTGAIDDIVANHGEVSRLPRSKWINIIERDINHAQARQVVDGHIQLYNVYALPELLTRPIDHSQWAIKVMSSMIAKELVIGRQQMDASTANAMRKAAAEAFIGCATKYSLKEISQIDWAMRKGFRDFSHVYLGSIHFRSRTRPTTNYSCFLWEGCGGIVYITNCARGSSPAFSSIERCELSEDYAHYLQDITGEPRRWNNQVGCEHMMLYTDDDGKYLVTMEEEVRKSLVAKLVVAAL